MNNHGMLMKKVLVFFLGVVSFPLALSCMDDLSFKTPGKPGKVGKFSSSKKKTPKKSEVEDLEAKFKVMTPFADMKPSALSPSGVPDLSSPIGENKNSAYSPYDEPIFSGQLKTAPSSPKKAMSSSSIVTPEKKAVKNLLEKNSPTRLFITPQKKSCVTFRVSPDPLQEELGGERITWKKGVLARLQASTAVENAEEENPDYPDRLKNPLTRNGFVNLDERVAEYLAWRLRGQDPAQITSEQISHSLSAKFILKVLESCSTYLEYCFPDPDQPDAEPNVKLLMVARVSERKPEGQLGDRDVPSKAYATLAFALTESGSVGQCVHCCIQNRHPVYTQFQANKMPRYLLAPCSVSAFFPTAYSDTLVFSSQKNDSFNLAREDLTERVEFLQENNREMYFDAYGIPEE